MILFGYTDNSGILLGSGESRYEPWGSSIGGGVWFSSWYVVSVDTGLLLLLLSRLSCVRLCATP